MNWDRVIQSLERSAEANEGAADRVMAEGGSQPRDLAAVSMYATTAKILNAIASALREGAP